MNRQFGLPPVVSVTSFGFRHGPPPAANVTVDARWLPNPFDCPELHDLSGMDAPVQRYLITRPGTEMWLDAVIGTVAPLIREARRSGGAVRVAVGCAGGHDRSVGMALILAARLPEIDVGLEVAVRHRDLHRRSGRDPVPQATS
jgi:UPF0042 nucleotide-binding protein